MILVSDSAFAKDLSRYRDDLDVLGLNDFLDADIEAVLFAEPLPDPVTVMVVRDAWLQSVMAWRGIVTRTF